MPYDNFRIQNEDFIAKRQITAELSRANRRSTQFSITTAYTSMTVNTKPAISAKSIRSKTHKPIEAKKFLNDDASETSTNISLLSLESKELLPQRKSYGNFNYVSFFEKYMNRRSKYKLSPHLMPKYVITTILKKV